MAWCVRTGRMDWNPLRFVRKLDERTDRRRERRALTDPEIARLLAVAEERGRKAWYLGALLAGLRKGDLRALTWGDVDFERGTLTIRRGKSGRIDEIPLHPALAEELGKIRPRALHPERLKVFPTTVTDRTRDRDFERAGIRKVDEAGRVADLHSLRHTFGTLLARGGMSPQLAQRLMRHHPSSEPYWSALDCRLMRP